MLQCIICLVITGFSLLLKTTTDIPTITYFIFINPGNASFDTHFPEEIKIPRLSHPHFAPHPPISIQSVLVSRFRWSSLHLRPSLLVSILVVHSCPVYFQFHLSLFCFTVPIPYCYLSYQSYLCLLGFVSLLSFSISLHHLLLCVVIAPFIFAAAGKCVIQQQNHLASLSQIQLATLCLF